MVVLIREEVGYNVLSTIRCRERTGGGGRFNRYFSGRGIDYTLCTAGRRTFLRQHRNSEIHAPWGCVDKRTATQQLTVIAGALRNLGTPHKVIPEPLLFRVFGRSSVCSQATTGDTHIPLGCGTCSSHTFVYSSRCSTPTILVFDSEASGVAYGRWVKYTIRGRY